MNYNAERTIHVKCSFCEKGHFLNRFEMGLEEFYVGDKHRRETNEIMVYDGYTWYRAEESPNYPKNVKKLIRFDPWNLEIPYIISKGNYYWSKAGQGYTGGWTKIKDENHLAKNTVYAIL